ncbi:MAG: TolC family protein [Myxococcota bacterium]|nr:TolC family protein [Myxococcota bacterium]
MQSRTLRTLTLCAAALAVGLGAATARAEDDPTQSNLASYRAPSLRGTLEMSLADAIAMGLENNLGVEIERHTPLIAYEDARRAWSPYDPEWNTEFGFSDDNTPNSLAFVSAAGFENQEEVLGGSGGIQALLPWLNTSLTTTLDTSETDTNQQIQGLIPRYQTGLTFVARQPLLRGLIWNESWTNVKTSHVAYRRSLEEFRTRVMDLVQDIEEGYWELIADEERVRVAEKSLETATALLDQVTTQYDVGVVSKVEIAEAEAGEAARDFELITAQNRYENTMDRLIDLVLGPNLTADTSVKLDPTDRPDEYVPYEIDVPQAATIALQRRPELAVADREIERLEIQLKFAKNQRLPQFDIEGRYGHDGLSGDPIDTAPPELGAQFSGDWADSFDPDSNSFGIRGILTIPLGNIEGRHSVSRAQLDLRRARVARRRQEQDIILQVRIAARTLLASQEGIEAAERGQIAAEEQLRAERIRLEYGESTPFDVLQREEDLVSAQQEYIAAFQTYRSSVTELDRAQGTILRNRNVRIEEVARLR